MSYASRNFSPQNITDPGIKGRENQTSANHQGIQDNHEMITGKKTRPDHVEHLQWK